MPMASSYQDQVPQASITPANQPLRQPEPRQSAQMVTSSTRIPTVSSEGDKGPIAVLRIRKMLGKAAALQAKRKRERARKKATKDATTGHEAERRVQFIRRSLQIAQEDFAVEDTIHSDQGYEGVRDGGADWRDSDPGKSRLDYLRNNRGYLVLDTTGQCE